MEAPPFHVGDQDLPEGVYEALIPLDGYPLGSRGGPRPYRYQNWWAVISVSDFGDLFVHEWGPMNDDERGAILTWGQLRATAEGLPDTTRIALEGDGPALSVWIQGSDAYPMPVGTDPDNEQSVAVLVIGGNDRG